MALALDGGEQALQGFGLVEARAQVDPGVEGQEGAEGDVVGLQAGQQHGDDRERGGGLLGTGLAVEAELDLAVLPAADALGAEQDDQGAATASAASSSGCQGLPPASARRSRKTLRPASASRARSAFGRSGSARL